MNTTQPPLKSRPIQDDEFRGTVVLVDSLLSLKDAFQEHRNLIEDFKTFFVHAVDYQLQVCKAFSDLYLELTDESERRRFLEKRYLKMEREAARLKLPLWFWKPEPDMTMHDMVKLRAEHLIQKKTLPDDIWDLLQDFIRDYVGTEISDDNLAAIIKEAGEVSHANA